MARQETGGIRWWVWAVGVVAIVAVVLLVSYSRRPSVTVKVAEATKLDLEAKVAANGTVESAEDYQGIAAAPGMVKEIYVELNQKVKAGQELLRMDDKEAQRNVAVARATLATAELQLQNLKGGGTAAERSSSNNDMAAAQSQEQQAETALHTTEALQAKGAASANEVTQAQQRVNDARMKMQAVQSMSGARVTSGDVSTQQAQVAQAQAQLAAAMDALSNVDQKAPFSGTIYALPVRQYDFVHAGDELLDLADLSRMQVRGYFDEPEVGRLEAGQPVEIRWDARPGLLWHGHILQAPTTIITYGTRHVGECIISVDDATGVLLPNTNVTVTVTTMKRFNVLSLPREALHAQGTNYYVYRVVNGKLAKTTVQIGTTNLTRFEVTNGLSEGDVVALGATEADVDLTNGLKVKVQQ